MTRKQWQIRAGRQLLALIRRAAGAPLLRRLGPSAPAGWNASVEVVGLVKMTRLNRRYRRKNRPTDVLSFEAPAPFRAAGMLGELVVCLPLMKRQARDLGHSEETELRILLAHGLLHLLGLDHEKSSREAARMARFERKLLGAQGKGAKGLIGRTQ